MPIGFEVGASAHVVFTDKGCEVKLHGKWSQLMIEAAYREMQRETHTRGLRQRQEREQKRDKEEAVELVRNPVIRELMRG